MVNPTRFPAGISTFKPNQVLNSFPTLPANNQTVSVQEFIPYIPAQWTVTSNTSTVGAGVWNAAAAALISGYNNGIVSMALTTGAGGTAAITLNGNAAPCAPISFIPGNQVWFNTQVALSAVALTDATLVTRYGFFSNEATPVGTVLNGIYFEKKAAAGGVLNLVIKNSGLTGTTVTTTINNVADVSLPSGIFGDTSSSVGSLITTGSANKYTSVVVNAPGSGYAQAPLVRTTGVGAAASFAQLYCQEQNGSLYAPYITNVGGTGYTTFGNEVNHWIDLSLYYDGKGRLYVGVNGKTVLTIGQDGTTTLAAGGTATTGAGNYFATNGSMTTSVAPILPAIGAFDNIMPMSPMAAGVGAFGATANTTIVFCDSLQLGVEYN